MHGACNGKMAEDSVHSRGHEEGRCQVSENNDNFCDPPGQPLHGYSGFSCTHVLKLFATPLLFMHDQNGYNSFLHLDTLIRTLSRASPFLVTELLCWRILVLSALIQYLLRIIMSDPKTFLKWGATDYELVPVQDPYGASLAWKLRKFDDESLKNIPSYTYKPLLGARKKIRLLQLMCGTMENPDISCQLVEANYDNVFHIPIIGDPQTSDKSSGSQSPDLADVKVHHPHINDEEMLGKLKLYDELTANEIKYEALSWCWGKDESDYALLIFERTASGHEKTYKLRVREQLALALKHLRHTDRSRTMWIDAVCIDQNNPSERNHQVQMMSRIYTRSDEVCIWLGDSDDSSKLAIDFIRDEIMELRNFDALSKGKQYTNKWKALMMLMQREWFSRRWVVQVSVTEPISITRWIHKS